MDKAITESQTLPEYLQSMYLEPEKMQLSLDHMYKYYLIIDKTRYQITDALAQIVSLHE